MDAVDAAFIQTTEEEKVDYALRAFYYDFCVLPSSTGSRGFFISLEQHIHRLGTESMLSKACQAVSYVTHGQSLKRQQLLNEAEDMYRQAVGSLARALESPKTSNTVEEKLTSVVLGLYEMARPTGAATSIYRTHAKGLAALISIPPSPLSYLNTSSSFHPFNSNNASQNSKQTMTLFTMPIVSEQAVRLDSLLQQLDSMLLKHKAVRSGNTCKELMSECIALRDRFTRWEKGIAPQAWPAVIRSFNGPAEDLHVPVGCRRGRVDTYPDLYIAGVWNIARAAKLLLVFLMQKLPTDQDDPKTTAIHSSTSETLVDNIFASVPYHLTDNLYSFLETNPAGIAEPGRTLGGLLLVMPLLCVSMLPIVSEEKRHYATKCLRWTAANMGIGLADVLAQKPCMSANQRLYGQVKNSG
ncbi:Transcription factor dbaG [Paramyrothecium foliicola]|nr:Transcription factor dbaG [Paramyrothecium foliicola]